MWRRWISAIVLWGLVVAPGGVGQADRSERSARRAAVSEGNSRAALLRQRGLEHFVSREFQLAADDLMEAYRLDQREATLFGWGEAVREMGDCELATRIYRYLLDRTSDFKLARQAEIGMATCKGAEQPVMPNPAGLHSFVDPPRAPSAADRLLAAEPSPSEDESASEGPSAASATEGDAEPADQATREISIAPEKRPPGLHTTSYILLGTGGFTALAGLATYVAASSDGNDPDATHAEITSARSKADWRRLISASVAAVGGGVTLIGILQYRKENRRALERRVAIAPYASASGAGLVVSGGF